MLQISNVSKSLLTFSIALLWILSATGGTGTSAKAETAAGCPAVARTPAFTLAYGEVTFDGEDATIGSVVTMYSPRNDLVGCFEITTTGSYGAVFIYGEATSVTPSIPGMRPDEFVQFQLDGIDITSIPVLNWNSDSIPHKIDLFRPEPAEIAGTFAIQGRSQNDVSLDVNLYIPGELVPSYTFMPTASTVGEFTVWPILPGTYEVTVQYIGSLQVIETVTLTAGSNSVDFGELRTGDANGDNVVSALDFSILATSFNLQAGDAGYDARADFNGDGVVSALDFSLLASNYNTAGEMPSGAP